MFTHVGLSQRLRRAVAFHSFLVTSHVLLDDRGNSSLQRSAKNKLKTVVQEQKKLANAANRPSVVNSKHLNICISRGASRVRGSEKQQSKKCENLKRNLRIKHFSWSEQKLSACVQNQINWNLEKIFFGELIIFVWKAKMLFTRENYWKIKQVFLSNFPTISYFPSRKNPSTRWNLWLIRLLIHLVLLQKQFTVLSFNACVDTSTFPVSHESLARCN